MFEKLRKPSKAKRKGRFKSLFSYIVFGTICLVFVFLSPMGTQIFGEGVVAYVGSEPIRAREFRWIEDNLKAQYRKRLNGADSSAFQNLQRKMALQQVISLYLISEGAKKEGFKVSDKELQDEIRSYPMFQRKGRFIYSQYLSFLKSQRISAVRFENYVRRIKMVEQWQNLFVKSEFSNLLEKNKNQERDLYKIKLRFAKTDISKIEELEPLILEKNWHELNAFLRKNKISWKTNKEISLFNSFTSPILKNKDFMRDILNHLPQQGLIPKLMIDDGKAYVVEILSFQQKPSKKSFLSPSLSPEKSARLLEEWIRVQEKKFPVQQKLDL